jgi:enoyl-CoA hydratase/carnithine racemase
MPRLRHLNDRVADLARTIADNAPLSLRAAKLAVAAAAAEPGSADERGVEDAVAACLASEDHREGEAAAREKRPPRFRGG